MKSSPDAIPKLQDAHLAKEVVDSSLLSSPGTPEATAIENNIVPRQIEPPSQIDDTEQSPSSTDESLSLDFLNSLVDGSQGSDTGSSRAKGHSPSQTPSGAAVRSTEKEHTRVKPPFNDNIHPFLPNPKLCTLERFETTEKTVDEIQLEVYNIFIEMLTGALKSQLKYSDKSADTIARKLINEGHLYDSSNPQDTDTQHYIEAVKKINNTAQAYQHFKYCCKIFQIHIQETEKAKRVMQLEEVAKILKRVVKRNKSDAEFISKQASTYRDLLTKVNHFLRNVNDAFQLPRN